MSLSLMLATLDAGSRFVERPIWQRVLAGSIAVGAAVMVRPANCSRWSHGQSGLWRCVSRNVPLPRVVSGARSR
jgi:hypothetical protein